MRHDRRWRRTSRVVQQQQQRQHQMRCAISALPGGDGQDSSCHLRSSGSSGQHHISQRCPLAGGLHSEEGSEMRGRMRASGVRWEWTRRRWMSARAAWSRLSSGCWVRVDVKRLRACWCCCVVVWVCCWCGVGSAASAAVRAVRSTKPRREADTEDSERERRRWSAHSTAADEAQRSNGQRASRRSRSKRAAKGG